MTLFTNENVNDLLQHGAHVVVDFPPDVHGPVRLGEAGLTDQLARHLCTGIYSLRRGAGRSLEVRPASQKVSYTKCDGFKSWAEVMITCKITGMSRTVCITQFSLCNRGFFCPPPYYAV